nr:glycosyltransferase [Clostridium tyrobutyricum]
MSIYNGQKYIKTTIESILSQSFSDFELVIIDDGSTDGTSSIIKSFKDKRIKLYELNKNYGVGYALNYGLRYCQNEYIAKVDGDDIYNVDRFNIQIKCLDINKDIDVVCSTTNFFPTDEFTRLSPKYKNLKYIFEKQTNSIITTEQIENRLYDFCCIEHTSTMFRTSVIKNYGYNPNYRICEDYNLFYNLNRSGHKFMKVKKPLVLQRVSNNSTTSLEKNKIYNNIYNIKKEYLLALFKYKFVFIWGAGSYGIEIQKIFNNNKLHIYGFIDSDMKKWQHKISNYKIYSPNVIDYIKNVKIVVASEPGRLEIAKYLENKGLVHLKDYVVV